MRHGASNEVGLDIGAQFIQFRNLLQRKRRDDGATVWIERDESFRLELPQRLTDRDPADAELGTDGVLPERASLGVVAAKNPLANVFLATTRG